MKIELPSLTAAHVLVVGDLMLDRYWHGDTSRISPEAPVPVVLVGESEERAGGAGNVALNISALGAKASLMGFTGDDEQCQALEKLLKPVGVDCLFDKLAGAATITKLRVLSRHQQLIRLDFEDGFETQKADNLLKSFQSQLSNAGAVVLSDYGKGTLRQVQEFIQIARKAGKIVLVDPKGSDFKKYRGATLITPNMHEFEGVVGRCEDDEDIVTKGQDLMTSLELQALLITRSERGMT